MELQGSLTVPSGVRASGVDLGDVARFRLAMDRCGERLIRRVFGEEPPTPDGSLPRDALMTAAFSMKESVIKVAGGLPAGGRYTDIHIDERTTDETGEPGPSRVRLTGALGAWAERKGVRVMAGKEALTDQLVLTWAVAVDQEEH